MRIMLIALLLAGSFLPVYAQESTMNKSERYDFVEVPFNAFNVVSKNATVYKLDHEHVTNWQVEIENKLNYVSPNSTAVIRLYEDLNKPKFIEIGMGAAPNYRFWVAVNTPEDGYFVIQDDNKLGWTPDKYVTATHSSNGGLTVSVGQKVAVTNLDIAGFTVREFTVHGMNSNEDPLPVDAGKVTLSFISGNPEDNPIFYMPMIVLAISIAVVVILLKSKKRTT
ncbi:MAG TPA: hypothetical protein VFP45_03665 [Candidatus Nitrosotalea sp.]|nr:hypothetical protein [Candidatus Nitrosotalea sp.]